MSWVQARDDVVAVGERLARDGDADRGGAGRDEPCAGRGVGGEGGVWRVGIGGGDGGHCWGRMRGGGIVGWFGKRGLRGDGWLYGGMNCYLGTW